MSDSPTTTRQLLDAIADPKVRLKVSLIVDLCAVAVADLDSLDQSIYLQPREPGTQTTALPSKEGLTELSGSVLEGVRSLATYLVNCDFSADSPASEDEAGMDFDFDLGGAPSAPDHVTLDDDDIMGALDGLAPHGQRSSNERWTVLSATITSLSYALSAQLKKFDARFQHALDGDRVLHGIRELDDVSNSLIDGVFALMSVICETYLDTFDRDTMLPGHRDTLGKALLVRRGLADLRRSVKSLNTCIQDAKAPDEDRQAAVDLVAEELAAFVEGEVFAAMRPTDRLELRNFYVQIANKPVKQAAMPCEGFDKYLDSLLSVNQRDVLIRHDREALKEIAALLEGVAPLVDISPHGAMDMVRQAFGKADALRGYHDGLDALLAEWENTFAPLEEPSALVEAGKRLAAIAGAAR